MPVVRCTRRYCGTVLTERHDRELGRVVFVCEPCERNRRGVCRDCPAHVKRNAMRCARCANRRNADRDRLQKRRVYADDVLRERKLARRRELNARPEVRAKRAAEQRQRRANLPKPVITDLDRLYKRTWQNQKYATDRAFRETQKARARERHRRATERQQAAKLASGQYRAVVVHGTKGKRPTVYTRLVRVTTAQPSVAA